MEYPGIWVNDSRTLIYRVVPKCACSTIGQILYFADHGAFFQGDVHDAKEGIWKWNGSGDQPRARREIEATIAQGTALAFTAVRNPYTRLLSAFFDKICSTQRTGNKYRGDMVAMIERDYAMDIGGAEARPFDQIAGFRKFLLFVRDTVKFNHPFHADIHWSPISGHLSTFAKSGGRYDRIFATEDFTPGIQAVLSARPGHHSVDLAALPRFNESERIGPKRAHPVEAFFDDLATSIMQDIYARDFSLFKYDPQPGSEGPLEALDASEITDKLAQ